MEIPEGRDPLRTFGVTEQARWVGVSFRIRWDQVPAAYASFLSRGPTCTQGLERQGKTESQESGKKG